jgi:hypothetical protein
VNTTPRIADELAGYLQSGLSITVATRDAELQPNGARAWAAVLDDDRSHLTVFLHESAAPPLVRDLEAHPEIAVAFDRPTNNRACQVKGVFVASRRARPGERAEIERQADGFLGQLETLGIPRAMTAGWRVWPCIAVTFRVDRLYEQTPGPRAGEPMR